MFIVAEFESRQYQTVRRTCACDPMRRLSSGIESSGIRVGRMALASFMEVEATEIIQFVDFGNVQTIFPPQVEKH